CGRRGDSRRRDRTTRRSGRQGMSGGDRVRPATGRPAASPQGRGRLSTACFGIQLRALHGSGPYLASRRQSGGGPRRSLSDPVRVLHVIPAVAPRYGGPKTANAPMCRALSTRGVESVIATTDADGAGRLPVPIGERTMWQGVPANFFRNPFTRAVKYSSAVAHMVAPHRGGF